MSEDTTVQGVTITTEGTNLIIHDLKKPLWHGDYHGGKLSIYEADQVPTMLPPCRSIVIIFVDQDNKDFVLTSNYEPEITDEDICSHIQAQTIIAYHKSQTKTPDYRVYVAGTDTLQ